MRRARTTGLVAIAIAVGVTLSGCASSSKGAGDTGSGGGKAGAAVNVGFIYSKTGLLSIYTPPYVAGFKAGLDYATKGTNKVDGHPIDVSYVDDTGTPTTAVNAAKSLIGKGDKIIMGTEDSGIAMQLAPLAAQNKVLYIDGAAAVDGITGSNKYTFRSGRQTYQDVATAGTFLADPKGKKVLVFAQDTAFGQGNAAAVKQVLGGKGAVVSQTLVPASATDFTPFALQVKRAKPDMVFVAWAGDTTLAVWKALDQQGIFSSSKVVTGLGNVGSYPAYGPVASKINFLGYYFPGASDNPVDKAMLAGIAKQGAQPDIFSPDGFVAAQMLVRAIQTGGGTDVDKMISGLSGWKFQAPKGEQTIRASDHAMLQPMYEVRLTGSGTTWKPSVVKTVPASETAPPQK